MDIKKGETGQDRVEPTSEGVLGLAELRCMYTNIDGVNSSIKCDSLELAIQQNNPHIIFLTETKLQTTDITSTFVNTCDYNIYQRDRGVIGGGVMIMVHKSLASASCENVSWEDIEAVATTVHINNKKLLLGCRYIQASGIIVRIQ